MQATVIRLWQVGLKSVLNTEIIIFIFMERTLEGQTKRKLFQAVYHFKFQLSGKREEIKDNAKV